MNLFKTLSSFAIGAAVIFAASQAPAAEPETSPDDLLFYDLAMGCGVLHGFFTLSKKDDKEQAKHHDDLSTRWLVLAMFRDGEDGNKATKEIEPLLLDLVERVGKMEDDEGAKTAFLEKGAAHCTKWQKAYQAKFDALEIE